MISSIFLKTIVPRIWLVRILPWKISLQNLSVWQPSEVVGYQHFWKPSKKNPYDPDWHILFEIEKGPSFDDNGNKDQEQIGFMKGMETQSSFIIRHPYACQNNHRRGYQMKAICNLCSWTLLQIFLLLQGPPIHQSGLRIGGENICFHDKTQQVGLNK